MKMTTKSRHRDAERCVAGLIFPSHGHLRADSPLILVFLVLTSGTPLIEWPQVPVRMHVMHRGGFITALDCGVGYSAADPYVAQETPTLRCRRLIPARWSVVKHKVDACLLIKATVSVMMGTG
jgi:hypothetical protein